MRKCLFILLLGFTVGANAQPTFVQDTAVVVKANGIRLRSPWAGGLNCPQFATTDLNGDGIKDLCVYDRGSGTVKTFLNKGTIGKADYNYVPQYEALFPAIDNMLLMYDYDHDGREDIFTNGYANGETGITVYKNTGTLGHPKYTLAYPLLYSTNTSSMLKDALPNSSVTIPAITDVDNDGDLDILTFNLNAAYVDFHQNMSMERYGNADSLVFQHDQGTCWGDFTGSTATNDVTLNQCSARHSAINHRVEHSGNSAFVAFDANGDGVQDLLIGDAKANNLVFLTNGGSAANANITKKDSVFPKYDTPVNINTFATPFVLDVDNDGLKDVIASPGLIYASENAQSAWLYKNTGTATSPHYTLQTKSFLQKEMIDVGEGAAPAFFDYNGDSLPDLLVGNYGYFGTTQYTSGIALYQNVGTHSNPAFQLITTDYASIAAMNINSVVPTFGDVDGDGDVDMVIGESGGSLYFFNNTAGAHKPASFVTPTATWMGINVGGNSTPQLVDVDKDGLLDLLIGAKTGNVVYYKNTGTKSTPNFSLITKSFGKIDTRPSGYITGYSGPVLFQCDKKNLLLCGTDAGSLYLYTNIDSNLTGNFTKADTLFNGINVGPRSMIALADINGDGQLDLAVGNYLGGVALYMQSANCTDTVKTSHWGIAQAHSIDAVTLMPNPATELLTVKASSDIQQLTILDLLGREQQLVFTANTDGVISLNVTNWPSGVYLCKVLLKNGVLKTNKISIFH